MIVDCWAEWCGPCKKLTPLLTDAVNKVEGDVVLYKVNVDMNERIPEALEVSAIPAVFAFNKGEVIASFVGVPSQEGMCVLVRTFVFLHSELRRRGRNMGTECC